VGIDVIVKTRAHPSRISAREKVPPSIAHTVSIVTYQTHDSKTLAIGLPIGSLPWSLRV
jgi:hypothetical protein